MVAVPIHAMNSRGSFVVCFHEHFVAVRKDEEGLWVNQTHRTHEWKPLCLRSGRGTALAWSQEQNHYELNLLEVDGVFRIEAERCM